MLNLFKEKIAVAHARQLDAVARDLWRLHGAGMLSDADALALSEAIEARRQRPRPAPQAATRRPSIFPPRRPQRSPDKARSIARRRTLAAAGPLPPAMAAHFTLCELAALKIVGEEVAENGACALTLAEIAARAGTCRTIVQGALRTAAALGLISVEERRRAGQKNLPNVVRIVSSEWLTWGRIGQGHRVQKNHPHGYQDLSEGEKWPERALFSVDAGQRAREKPSPTGRYGRMRA